MRTFPDGQLVYLNGRFEGEAADSHKILRCWPGEAPDGSCRYEVVADCPSFDAILAASALLGPAFTSLLPDDPFDPFAFNCS